MKDFVVKNRYLLSFVCLAIVYILNLRLDVMDVDAAQYASIAMEMWESGSFLQVYHQGADYLDKPPLLFWLSSASMGLFGYANWAYKLPALLIIVLGIYSTFRFALMYYKRSKAQMAALILATTQAFFLITNDVRMDGMLTGFVIFAVWQIARFLKENKLQYLVYGAVGVAGAMMTKGPLGLVLVGFAFFGDLLIKRNWKGFLKWEWLLAGSIVAILLLPMTYGLYQQFDLHPEKEVYGLIGPSGVEFFFWTQSFGRITGDIYWSNDAGYLYFLQTIIWDFQPWVIFLFFALFLKFRNLVKIGFKGKDGQDWMSLSCFVLGILSLSLSSYKLPHYIFPLFPFAAVLVADFIGNLSPGKYARRLGRVQFGFMVIFHLAPFVSFFFFFTPETLWLPAFLIVADSIAGYLFFNSRNPQGRIIWPTVVTTLAFGFMLSTYFYPNLMQYQSESQVGRDVVDVPKGQFFIHHSAGNSLQFYSQRIVPTLKLNELRSGMLVYTDEEGKEELLALGPFEVIKSYDDFHVSGLSLEFLLKSSRASSVEKKYLLKVQNE